MKVVIVVLLALVFLPFNISKAKEVSEANKPHLKIIHQKVYQKPQVFPAADWDDGDVKALFYSGLDYKGKPTRVFAYVGIPKLKEKNQKFPGVVLIHGGGGTAFSEWVKIWNDKGYAAIAMDLEGTLPKGRYSERPKHEFSGPMRDGMFNDAGKPLQDQWMYHAVSDVMIANTLLASMPEVDQSKIGVTGISWGGVLSSLISGMDSRFQFAVPVYGCGYLYDSKGHFKRMRSEDQKIFKERKFWDPARYFKQAKMPMLWVNGDSDAHFSVDVFSKSKETVKGNSNLCIHPGMRHGHGPGYDPKRVPEIYAFADSILKGKSPLPVITKQPSGRSIELSYKSESQIVESKVHFLDVAAYSKKENWVVKDWQHQPLTVKRNSKSVSGELPKNAKAYYVNIKDSRGLIVSSNFQVIED